LNAPRVVPKETDVQLVGGDGLAALVHVAPTRVAKTGQVTCYAAGDDTDLETGVAPSLSSAPPDIQNKSLFIRAISQRLVRTSLRGLV